MKAAAKRSEAWIGAQRIHAGIYINENHQQIALFARAIQIRKSLVVVIEPQAQRRNLIKRNISMRGKLIESLQPDSGCAPQSALHIRRSKRRRRLTRFCCPDFHQLLCVS